MNPQEHTDDIWNGESPRVAWFKLKHRDHGLDSWDSKRITRVCKIIHCTVPELCAACGFYDRKRIMTFYKKKRWPVWLTIQFERYEASAVAAKLNVPQTFSGGDLSFATAFGNTLG